MENNANQKSKKSLLKKIATIMIFVGLIIFVIGFFAQFISVASMADSMTIEEPKNYFVVIITGFAIMFLGTMLNMVDGVVRAKDIHENITNAIKDNMVVGQRERMQQPVEIYCEYCGTLLHENERECPNCGAGRTKK